MSHLFSSPLLYAYVLRQATLRAEHVGWLGATASIQPGADSVKTVVLKTFPRFERKLTRWYNEFGDR